MSTWLRRERFHRRIEILATKIAILIMTMVFLWRRRKYPQYRKRFQFDNLLSESLQANLDLHRVRLGVGKGFVNRVSVYTVHDGGHARTHLSMSAHLMLRDNRYIVHHMLEHATNYIVPLWMADLLDAEVKSREAEVAGTDDNPEGADRAGAEDPKEVSEGSERAGQQDGDT